MAPDAAERAPAPPPAGQRLVILILLALAALLPYLPTLAAGFVYDDHGIVVHNPIIRDWSNAPRLFTAAWRPLKRLSLMLDYHLWGLEPAGYHLTNVILHVLTTLALFACVRALGGKRPEAWVAALLFALHPAASESVAVITHRKEPMATLFLLLALTAHAGMKASPVRPLALIALFSASLLSKETVGAALPLLLVAHEALRRGGRPGEAKARWLSRLAPVAALLALPLFLLLFRLAYQERHDLLPFFTAEHIQGLTGGALESYPEILATVVVGFWRYLGVLLWPVGLCADRPHHWNTGLLDPLPLLAAAGLCLYLAGAWRLRRRAPLVALGLFWLPLALLPVSNLVPLTPWFLAERFLYLPAAGFALAAAGALGSLARMPGWTHVRLGIVAAVAVGYGALTLDRVSDWNDDQTIWSRTLEQNPSSAIAHAELARLHHEHGRLALAVRHYAALLERSPENRLALTNLGELLARLGRPEQALAALEQGVTRFPQDARLRNNLGNGYRSLGRNREAAEQYRFAVRLDPDLAEALVNLGTAEAMMGNLEEAESRLRHALDLAPDLTVARVNLARLERLRREEAPGTNGSGELCRQLAAP